MSNRFSLKDLNALARRNKQNITEEEKQDYNEAKSILDSFASKASEAHKELATLLKSVHIQMDHHTMAQLMNELGTSKKEAEQKLYEIIKNDIVNAYQVIQGQLGDTYPNWTEDYMLKDIDVHVIVDEWIWKQYVHENSFDNLVLPGCATTTVPICLRFRKSFTEAESFKTPWSTEIRFLDVICLMSGKPAKTSRIQLVHAVAISSRA